MNTPVLIDDPDARESLRLSCEVLDRAERCGRAAVVAQAELGVACCYRHLGALGAAELHLQRALAWARVAHSPDAVVEVLCELCDVGALRLKALDDTGPDADAAAAHALREQVRDLAFEAGQQAARVADSDWEVKVLLHVSDVLNRLGDHDDAATLQTRALRLMSGAPAGENPSVLPGLGRLAS